MSVSSSPTRAARLRAGLTGGGAQRSRGDQIMYLGCLLAAVIAALVLAEVVYQVITGASEAFHRFGVSFIGHQAWAPNFGHFGAAVMLYGTAVTAALAMLIAVPLSIAIALYLALLAPATVRTVVGSLVEMLAAIPSVVLGFFGIIFLAPFLVAHVEPALHSVLGFLPIFGPPGTTGLSAFTAGVVLSVMIIPIIAALSRDLFLTVPREQREGAEALGATPWEVVRGVVLPHTATGVAAACALGLGRALGEAIAVASVIGTAATLHPNLFDTSNTLSARIVQDIQYPVSRLQVSSIFYLAVLLLALSFVTNLTARAIARRYDVHRTVA
jgi:phosphate transport system permease protein